MFLGLITKHHLVHIAPVPIRARFCVRDSVSAGRAKSLIPARTRAHYHHVNIMSVRLSVMAKYLHDRCPARTLAFILPTIGTNGIIPEMHRLDTHRAVPQSLDCILTWGSGCIYGLKAATEGFAGEPCAACTGKVGG